MRNTELRLLVLSLLMLLVPLYGNALAEPVNTVGSSYPRLYFTKVKLTELRKKISDDQI